MQRTLKSLILGSILALSMSSALAAGAIAVNDEEGAADYQYAMVTYASSDAAAGRDALDDCRAQGNKSCVVMARFNQCGALAVSNKFFRVGTGVSAQEASRKALESCPGCRLAQVACDSSIESVRYASVGAE